MIIALIVSALIFAHITYRDVKSRLVYRRDLFALIIVRAVLNTCSIVCDLAVAFIFCLPLKYPLITEDIATKKIAGDNATKVISAPGICNQ